MLASSLQVSQERDGFLLCIIGLADRREVRRLVG